MPLSNIQATILQTIAKNRSLESYVAGASVIHAAPRTPRFSHDVDIFHDDQNAVAKSAVADEQALRQAGFSVEWREQFPTFFRAVVRCDKAVVEIDWAADSAYRFFPLEPDPLFGFKLHPLDVATNKVLAFVGRCEIRDLIDCLHLHKTVLSLGALIWAACGKDEGYTPERILNEAQRRAHFRASELSQLDLVRKPDPVRLRTAWDVAITKARRLAESLPAEELGCLYIDPTGKAVTPNPKRGFTRLVRHRGTYRGILPVIHSLPTDSK